MLIDWNESLVLGDARIDQEHEDLATLINRFFSVLKSGASRDVVCEVAFTLGERVTQHFNNEVDLMEAAGYPGKAAHQREHKILIGELGDFLHRVGEEEDSELLKVANFIERWFIGHVTTADAQFVKFLKEDTPCETVSDEVPLAEMW